MTDHAYDSDSTPELDILSASQLFSRLDDFDSYLELIQRGYEAGRVALGKLA